VLKVNKATPKVPKNYGKQWWAEAMKEVNSVKRRLTQKAMKFVDEAVRRSLEEKQRQATERREARQLGLGKEAESCTVLIEEDVELSEPERQETGEDNHLASYAELGDDYDPDASGFKPASDEEEDDDDEEKKAKKKRKTEAKERKASHKEQMSEALQKHFNALNEPQEEGEDGERDPNADFANFAEFNAQKAHNAAHGIDQNQESEDDSSSGDDSSTDDEANQKRSRAPIDYWGEPPEDLLERQDLEDSVDGSRAYVAHFIRYVMGMWHQYFKKGHKIEGSGLTQGAVASFNSAMVVEKTREALTPILVKLQKNTLDAELLRRIDSVVALAANRDYKTCMQEYVVCTMGRKTWHQSLSQAMMQQNHGGSICKIITQSQFIDFDYDPTINAFMLALKRVIQFLQWLRPPTDASKGSY